MKVCKNCKHFERSAVNPKFGFCHKLTKGDKWVVTYADELGRPDEKCSKFKARNGG